MSEYTQSFDREADEVIKPLWLAGWHAYTTMAIGIVVLAVIGQGAGSSPVAWGFYGLLLGAVAHFAGIYYVTNNWRRLVDNFVNDVESAAREMMGMAGENVSTYTLRYSFGGRRLLSPDRVHEPTVLVVGDASLAVHEDAILELDMLTADVGTKSREYYFDSITSVNYEDPHFQIKTSDGSTDQYESTREPDDALYDLQERLREYKAA